MLNVSTALHVKVIKNDVSHFNRGDHLSQLGVNYRGSSIVVDERNTGESNADAKVDSYTVDGFVRAGDRAPDASGLKNVSGASRLFDIFKPYHHTVLLFASGSDVAKIKAIIQVLQQYPPGKIRSVILYSQGATHANEMVNITGPDFALEDEGGHAFEGYGIPKDQGAGADLTVVAVRPDGVIGAIAYGTEKVRKYFDAIFSNV